MDDEYNSKLIIYLWTADSTWTDAKILGTPDSVPVPLHKLVCSLSSLVVCISPYFRMHTHPLHVRPSLLHHSIHPAHFRSQDVKAPSIPKIASFPIEFLIVGGGVGGLACAVALRHVGHRVSVVEKDSSIDSVSIFSPHQEAGLTTIPDT